MKAHPYKIVTALCCIVQETGYGPEHGKNVA